MRCQAAKRQREMKRRKNFSPSLTTPSIEVVKTASKTDSRKQATLAFTNPNQFPETSQKQLDSRSITPKEGRLCQTPTISWPSSSSSSHTTTPMEKWCSRGGCPKMTMMRKRRRGSTSLKKTDPRSLTSTAGDSTKDFRACIG